MASFSLPRTDDTAAGDTPTLDDIRADGRLIEDLDLNEIDESYLIRDRMAQDEDALRMLMDSIRDRGQQTPIDVVDLPDPSGVHRYGLIAGWRRLNALRRLRAETGDDAFATVKAQVRPPQPLAESYVAMVEENEIRIGLSYFERARIVLRAIDQGVFPNARIALKEMFGHASRARRSKIRAFVDVVEALDGALAFPTELGERLGLDVARQVAVDKGWGAALAVQLRAAAPATAEAEQALIAAALNQHLAGSQGTTADGPAAQPAPASAPSAPASRPRTPPPPPPPSAQTRPSGTEPTPPKTAIEARPGVFLEGMTDPDGSRWLVLSGPGIDDRLAAALRAWLAHGTGATD